MHLRLSYLFALLTFAIFLTGATDDKLPPSKSHQKETKTETKGDKPETARGIPAINQDSPAVSPNPPQNYNYNYQPTKSGEDLPAWIQAICTIVLALFAALQFYFFKETLRANRALVEASAIQAKATEKSAKAAADNVIATRELANLERPWISVKPNPDIIDALDWPFRPTTQVAPPFQVSVKWTAKNTGRTPAFITKMNINFVCDPYPIPDEIPNYGTGEEIGRMIIEPNGGTHSSQRWLNITPDCLADIMARKRCVKFFGYVEYYDAIHKEPHKTRFCCYSNMPDSNRPWILIYEPVGPPNTVEYT